MSTANGTDLYAAEKAPRKKPTRRWVELLLLILAWVSACWAPCRSGG